jgi:NTE family protein
MQEKTKAIVCGGGGVAGIAWEIGYLVGLYEAGIDITTADLYIGTSAGAVAAAQVTSGVPLRELYNRQIDPALQADEKFASIDMAKFANMLKQRYAQPDLKAERQKQGMVALSAQTISEAERRKIIASRLPLHVWSKNNLRIIAIDAETGEETCFDKHSGVDLIDAIAASTALPGVWPPATINNRRYIDGGVRTMENADLAEGYDLVLILQPLPIQGVDTLKTEIETLHSHGSITYTAQPDAASKSAIGPNPLDPAVRSATARAAYSQAQLESKKVKRLW